MDKEKNKKILDAIVRSEAGGNLKINLKDEKAVQLILDYISTHKWLINEKISFKVSCDQAIFSWTENVYNPLMYAIENSLVLKAFPGKSMLEIFSDISDLHYETIKNSGKEYIPYEAICKKYILKESKNTIIKFLTKVFY